MKLTMKCPHCKGELRDISKFCPHCGQAIDNDTVQSSEQEEANKEKLTKEEFYEEQAKVWADPTYKPNYIKKDRKSAILLASWIAGILYAITFFGRYFLALNLVGSEYDVGTYIGMGLATVIFIPHMLCTAFSVIFNILGWSMRRPGFALTGGILYIVAIATLPTSVLNLILPAILSFVGFALLKKQNTEAQIADDAKISHILGWIGFVIFIFLLYGDAFIPDLFDSDTTQTTITDSSNGVADEPQDEAQSEPEDDIPQEYKNALKKAESFSQNMHMSKQGIYDQLTSEYGSKFPADAAQYAIDNLVADYKANALEKAKSYYYNMNMSKDDVWDQLVSEYGGQFTQEEADYAIANLE